MKRPYLSGPARSELTRLEDYAKVSQGASDLLAVVTDWLAKPGRELDLLRRAVDDYRRKEIAQARDPKWIALHERGIGTLVVMVDGSRGTIGAIDLRGFHR